MKKIPVMQGSPAQLSDFRDTKKKKDKNIKTNIFEKIYELSSCQKSDRALGAVQHCRFLSVVLRKKK